jgi:hypothetical protein
MLRERLLGAGVAPRHVRRYVRELAEHYDDALRAELATGVSLARAREAAWARLGSEEHLAQSVLARPELRSAAARFPALAFGLAPALGWVAAPILVAGAASLLPEALRRSAPSAELVSVLHALLVVHARLLPVLLGALALALAAERRLRPLWPVIGAAVVDLLAGTLSVYVVPGELGVSSSLLPWLVPFSDAFGPREVAALGAGVLKAAGLLAASLLAQRVFQRLRGSDELAAVD